MAIKLFEFILNNVLLTLQICLGAWQFTKLTPVGALIQGVVGWMLPRFGRSTTYSRLQHFEGRIFKRANCFVLQVDIPSEMQSIEVGTVNTIRLWYLGESFVLERRGSEGHMLFVDNKMSYYITPNIWKELLAAATYAAAYAAAHPAADAAYSAADAANAACAADASARSYFFERPDVVLKGQREFWEEVSTGGVMSLEEILDGLILNNQHMSFRLNVDWLLPVNLSVSEEKLLKFLNVVAVFLQTKKEQVHWVIPVSLSFIAALLEFSTTMRVWLYNNINVLFCHMTHFLCNPLPCSWRRHVYSLGKWVENLKPSNDIQLKSGRANLRTIIGGGSKVDKACATLVPFLNTGDENADVVRIFDGKSGIVKRFHCNSIDIYIECIYFEAVNS